MRIFITIILLVNIHLSLASGIGNMKFSVRDDGRRQLNDDSFISGSVGVDGGNLFYLMFDSRTSPSTDPLLIWLNGGPGCSSLIGAFTENGPYNVKFNSTGIPMLSLEKNNYSWNQNANLLYLD